MIRLRDEAFVLGTHELGEADLIVTLLTEGHGRKRAVARSARRSRRRFGGLLEPMTRVRATWVEREGRDLHRLEDVEEVRSFAEMQAEPLRQAACAVLSEIAAAFSPEGEADPRQFRLVGAVLHALEREGSPRALLRYFEYWTLRGHGLLPDLETCCACGRPLATKGPLRVSRGRGPICGTCPGLPGEPEASLRSADRGFLEQVRRVPPAALEGAPGGAVEVLLRGAIEAFAERSFRAYRHFKSAEALSSDGGRR